MGRLRTTGEWQEAVYGELKGEDVEGVEGRGCGVEGLEVGI
jgi:hypothetical protein